MCQYFVLSSTDGRLSYALLSFSLTNECTLYAYIYIKHNLYNHSAIPRTHSVTAGAGKVSLREVILEFRDGHFNITQFITFLGKWLILTA
jgi:hypothetical protein